MKRKLLMMLLLVAGATTYAQQNNNLHEPTPDITDVETPCREFLFEALPESNPCAGNTIVNVRLLHFPKETTSVTWVLTNSEKKEVAKGYWAPTATQNISLPSLRNGNYTLAATQQPNGCYYDIPFDLYHQERLQMNLLEKQDIHCDGKEGSVLLQVQGGNGSYVYGWERIDKDYKPCTDYTPVRHTTYPEPNEIDGDYCWQKGYTKGSERISLGEGTWKIYVGSGSCVMSETITISKKSSPQFATFTPDRCATTDGALTPVKVTLAQKGEGTHYYSIDSGAEQEVNFQGNTFVVYTSAGTHKIHIRDGNNCTADDAFTVHNHLTAKAQLQQAPTCNMKGDIAAVVTVEGDSNTYNYTLEYQAHPNAPTTTIIADGSLKKGTNSVFLTAGVGAYRFKIYDSETVDCPVTTEITIKEPNNFVLETSEAIRALCATGEGTITLTLVETEKSEQPVRPDFSYRILKGSEIIKQGNVNGYTTALQLKGGTYLAEVTVKATGCVLTKEIAIPEDPTPIQVKAESKLSSNCNDYKGEIKVNITGGTALYTLSLTHKATGAVTEQLIDTAEYTFAQVAAGNYTIAVKDALGCNEYEGTTSVTVTPSFVIEKISVSPLKPITCKQKEEVAIKISVSPEYIKGTWLRYTIKDAAQNYQKVVRLNALSLSLNGNDALAVGNYTIEVLNEQTGCVASTTYTVKEPNNFALETSEATRALCATGEGTITLTLVETEKSEQSVRPDFSYCILKGSEIIKQGNVNGYTTTLQLKGGTYLAEVTVKAIGCVLTKEIVIPENPVPVQVTAKTLSAADCNNSKATAEVQISNGRAPYTVTFSMIGGTKVHSQTTSGGSLQFDNLEAGSYRVYVTDQAGCSADTSLVIATSTPITTTNLQLSTQQPTCVGEKDATLAFSVTTTGGVAPYSYKLEKLNNEKPEVIAVNFTNNGALIEGLGAGVYRLYVEDSKGCQFTLTNTVIYDPYPISAQIDLTNSVFRSCNGEKTGSVVVSNITGGTGIYSVYIVSFDRKKVIDRKTEVKAGDTVTFTGLAPQESTYYQVVIQDSKKCLYTDLKPFAVKDESLIGIEKVTGEYVCDPTSEKGYTVMLTVKFKNKEVDFNDLTYSINQSGARPFTRTEGNIAYIDNFTGITTTHTIEVSHKGGSSKSACPSSVMSFVMSPLSPFTLERVPNDELNTIEVIAKGGITTDLVGYTYYFNGENNGNNPIYKVKNSDPERLENGVRIKTIDVIAVDAEGCRRKLQVEIPYIDVDIPNHFTPNGDGSNDRWRPDNLKDHPNALVHVYDRYGRRMATLKPGESWDGVYEGHNMPSGDYWYVIDLNDALIDGRKIYGHFSLYR